MELGPTIVRKSWQVNDFIIYFNIVHNVCRGHAVAQLVEALRYKSEGRGFDSRWCHSIFFIDVILPAALWLWG